MLLKYDISLNIFEMVDNTFTNYGPSRTSFSCIYDNVNNQMINSQDIEPYY